MSLRTFVVADTFGGVLLEILGGWVGHPMPTDTPSPHKFPAASPAQRGIRKVPHASERFQLLSMQKVLPTAKHHDFLLAQLPKILKTARL